VKLNLIITNI